MPRQSTLRPKPSPICALPSPGRLTGADARRQVHLATRSPEEILASYQPGRTPPLQVLEVLLQLFNAQHTALQKTVSHKTRQERAQFLRRFFMQLKTKAGFKTLPDPRNIGHKHIHAMVHVWQAEKLAPATLQTYLSFLRGLAQWVGKPGLVRQPGQYGMAPAEYERHGCAQRDKSWTAAGMDSHTLIAQVCAYDRHVGASLRLIQAFGLRRKESIQMRPYTHVKPSDQTHLPETQQTASHYLWVKGKGGRVRWIAIDSAERQGAIDYARSVVSSLDASVGDPQRDLKRNMRRFDYVLEKFGITARKHGATAHGLRHEVLIKLYEERSGALAPVRGGEPPADKAVELTARQAVSQLAGHYRLRVAHAYIGSHGARSPDAAGRPGGSGRGEPQVPSFALTALGTERPVTKPD